MPPHPQYQQSAVDPLISPDYNGWWQRVSYIVKRGWKPLALLQVVGAAIAVAMRTPVAIYSAHVAENLEDFGSPTDYAQSLSDFADTFTLLGWSLLAAFLQLIITGMIAIASIHISVMVVTGSRPDIAVALRGAVNRFLPLLGWQFLAGLVILVGICACVLPALYFAAVLVVLPAVVAFERGGAIARCFSLFHGDFGSAIARVATILGILLGGAIVGGALGAALNAAAQSTLPPSTGLVVGTVISTAVSVVVYGALGVLSSPLTLAAYADMRARVEPLSTAVLVQELGLVSSTTG